MNPTVNRDRLLVLSSALLFAIAGSILLFVWFFQNRASSTRQPYHYTPDPVYLAQIDRQVKEAIAGAKRFREAYRPWSQKHAADIAQMRRGGTAATAACQRVYDALPDLPSKEDVGFNLKDLASVVHGFTWSHHLERMPVTAKKQYDATARALLAKARTFNEESREHDLSTFHDLVLTESTNNGPCSILLWASGRITRSCLPRHIVGERDAQMEVTQEEITPAFEAVP